MRFLCSYITISHKTNSRQTHLLRVANKGHSFFAIIAKLLLQNRGNVKIRFKNDRIM